MTRNRSNTIEIAELTGVSKQRAHQIADEDGSPAPVAEEVRDASGIGARSRRGRRNGQAANPWR